MKLLLILFLASGSTLIGVSIPLIRRRVAPNPWYGFRVRATLSDADIWYPANAYAAWRILWTGVAILLASIGVYFVPKISQGTYGAIILAVVVVGLAVTLVQSFRFLAQLTKQKQPPTDGGES